MHPVTNCSCDDWEFGFSLFLGQMFTWRWTMIFYAIAGIYNQPTEMRCSSNQLRCLNGHCIDGTHICDGESDCPDGSDENQCGVQHGSDRNRPIPGKIPMFNRHPVSEESGVRMQIQRQRISQDCKWATRMVGTVLDLLSAQKKRHVGNGS